MAYVRPTPGDVHVNRPLTNLAIAFMQSEGKFIARRVFPQIPVENQSNAYFTFPREAFWRDEMKKRAPATETEGITWPLSLDTYHCDVWGLHNPIADMTRANADAPVQLDRRSSQLLMQQALIRMERDWVSQFFAQSAWNLGFGGHASTRSGTPDPSAGTKPTVPHWNAATGTPIEDIRFACDYMQQITGMRPNVLVLPRRVYSILIDLDEIIGRLNRGQTTGPAMANKDSLAALFEVEEILTLEAIYNSAAEGLDASFQWIGGSNDALLAYRASAPGIDVPSAGYSFTWSGYVGMSDGVRIKRFREEKKASDIIEIEATWDHKVTSQDLGFFFTDIVA